MIELERAGHARNGLPESRPYVYNGTGEDIYGVTGRLEDVLDIGPGPEWYRERGAEDGDELAELTAARDRYQAAQAMLNAPPEPAPAAPPPGYGGRPLPPVRVPDHRDRPQGGA